MNILDLTEIQRYNNFFKEHISTLISDKLTPTKIYHYTNIYGLKGILENNKFWISHIDFLNDKTEIKHTLSLSEEIMQTLCEEEGLNQRQTDYIMNEYKKMIDLYFVEKKINYYSLSFSTNPDSNLLWSNYSQNDGYCIEFDLENLVDNLRGNGFHTSFTRKI